MRSLSHKSLVVALALGLAACGENGGTFSFTGMAGGGEPGNAGWLSVANLT